MASTHPQRPPPLQGSGHRGHSMIAKVLLGNVFILSTWDEGSLGSVVHPSLLFSSERGLDTKDEDRGDGQVHPWDLGRTSEDGWGWSSQNWAPWLSIPVPQASSSRCPTLTLGW